MDKQQRSSILSTKEIAVFILIIIVSFWVSQINFLLFHSTIEVFSIVVGVLVFAISRASYNYEQSDYFVFLGNAFLFVAIVDFLHMLAYKGMNVFPGISTDIPTQLWIAARYIESISILISPIFIKRKLNKSVLFFVYFLIVSAIIASIFYFKIFPKCYIDGFGLTHFKKASEYTISVILLISLWLLWRKRSNFDRDVLIFLTAAIFSTIISELFFTLYVSVFAISNVFGHILKIMAFYFFYKALVRVSLENPMKSIFFSLEKENKEFKDYLEYAGVIFLLLDKDGRVVLINKKCSELLGLSKDDVIGKDWFIEFLPENIRSQTKAVFLSVLQGEKPLNEYFENPVVTKNGIRILHWQNTLLKSSDGQIVGILSSAEDVTERKETEEKLRYLATIDGLTEVYNKSAGIERLASGLKNAAENKSKLTLVFIDANGLKNVNDNYGHTEGDEYLRILAQSLRKGIITPSIIFRFGGDEFVLVLNGFGAEEARAFMRNVTADLDEINRTINKPYKVSISYGLAEFDPENLSGVNDLLSTADKEMYKMKNKFYEGLRKRNQFKDWS
jgi:diguanylate cyclase (GGDEF)-like protein/PAS domain S-box-containing protein